MRKKTTVVVAITTVTLFAKALTRIDAELEVR